MPRVAACTLCDGGFLEPFLQLPPLPVHVGVLWSDAVAARSAARGPITLGVCQSCGLIANTVFDESLIDYSQKYDNALHASPTFQAFEQDLAAHLTQRYDLEGKTVVEIGCGNGHFLGLLARTAGAKGLGYDPSHDPASVDPLAEDRVTFVRGEYPGGDVPPPAALLCCRQTLEHIPRPRAFLEGLRSTLPPGAVVYFEVPNSTMPFRELSIWDLIYEHCTYFVEASLSHAFEVSGYQVLDVRETYEQQFLSLEASPSEEAPPPGLRHTDWLLGAVAAFAARFEERQDTWHQRLAELRGSGRRAVVWGGGARAVTFFNLLEIQDDIEYVIDMNPAKQGTFLGGTGQAIVAPAFLSSYRPDVVIILNPLYREEIAASLRELGVEAEVVVA